MKKELKDYLHLYLNSVDVIIDSVSEQFKSHFGHSPGHKTQLGPMLYAVILEDGCTVKLILRPLSSITEEERQKLFDQIWPSGLWSIVEAGKSWVIGHILDIDEDWSNLGARVQEVISIETWSSIINWLRKNKFDCDGLIESGLAVTAETLK